MVYSDFLNHIVAMVDGAPSPFLNNELPIALANRNIQSINLFEEYDRNQEVPGDKVDMKKVITALQKRIYQKWQENYRETNFKNVVLIGHCVKLMKTEHGYDTYSIFEDNAFLFGSGKGAINRFFVHEPASVCIHEAPWKAYIHNAVRAYAHRHNVQSLVDILASRKPKIQSYIQNTEHFRELDKCLQMEIHPRAEKLRELGWGECTVMGWGGKEKLIQQIEGSLVKSALYSRRCPAIVI